MTELSSVVASTTLVAGEPLRAALPVLQAAVLRRHDELRQLLLDVARQTPSATVLKKVLAVLSQRPDLDLWPLLRDLWGADPAPLGKRAKVILNTLASVIDAHPGKAGLPLRDALRRIALDACQACALAAEMSTEAEIEAAFAVRNKSVALLAQRYGDRANREIIISILASPVRQMEDLDFALDIFKALREFALMQPELAHEATQTVREVLEHAQNPVFVAMALARYVRQCAIELQLELLPLVVERRASGAGGVG